MTDAPKTFWDVILTNEGGDQITYEVNFPTRGNDVSDKAEAIRIAWQRYRELDYVDNADAPWWTEPKTFRHG